MPGKETTGFTSRGATLWKVSAGKTCKTPEVRLLGPGPHDGMMSAVPKKNDDFNAEYAKDAEGGLILIFRSSFRAQTRNPIAFACQPKPWRRLVVANHHPCEAIPITIKAMVLTQSSRRNAEKILSLGKTMVSIKAIKALTQGEQNGHLKASSQSCAVMPNNKLND